MKKHFATSTTLLETPCGQLLLGAESGRLCLCSWLRETVQTTITSDADGQLLSEACRAGHPTALRAIGNANGRNPLAIIVPCHRVIASNGQLGGYSSGLDYKRFLLRLEGVACR